MKLTIFSEDVTNLYEKIVNRKEKVSLIGIYYAGMLLPFLLLRRLMLMALMLKKRLNSIKSIAYKRSGK
jgi:hypothetical protein